MASLVHSEWNQCILEDDAFRTILDMFLAGTETTNTTLQWLFIYLMYNTAVQDKCREEIYQVRVVFILTGNGCADGALRCNMAMPAVLSYHNRLCRLETITGSSLPVPYLTTNPTATRLNIWGHSVNVRYGGSGTGSLMSMMPEVHICLREFFKCPPYSITWPEIGRCVNAKTAFPGTVTPDILPYVHFKRSLAVFVQNGRQDLATLIELET